MKLKEEIKDTIEKIQQDTKEMIENNDISEREYNELWNSCQFKRGYLQALLNIKHNFSKLSK